MSRAISRERTILDKIAALTPQQHNQVIDLIDSLTVQPESQNNQMSAYEAGKQWAGCVDSGIGDLSTNKQYMEGFGKE